MRSGAVFLSHRAHVLGLRVGARALVSSGLPVKGRERPWEAVAWSQRLATWA